MIHPSLFFIPEAKYFFGRSAAPSCEKVIFVFEKAILHLQPENQYWENQFLVASEI